MAEKNRTGKRKNNPFLQSPPLDIDLYTSRENLSLIVGHNGSHKSSYNDMLDKELKNT